MKDEIALELIEKLQELRDGLDIWDEVCPACNGVKAHNGHCISFGIDNLLIRAKTERIIHWFDMRAVTMAVPICGKEGDVLLTMDKGQVTCEDCRATDLFETL